MIRLPLHIGHEARRRAAVAAALFPVGALCCWQGLYAFFVEGHGSALAIGIVLLILASAFALLAWWTRGSDAVLDEHGLRVEGGPYHGTSIRWDELATAEILGEGELWVGTKGGQRDCIAAVTDTDERESLQALLQTLRARLGEVSPSAPTTIAIPECAECRAPLPPSAESTVACVMCGATNPVAPTLQQQVTAQRAIERDERAITNDVTQLLQQPGATRANGFLLIAMLACVLGALPFGLALHALGVEHVDAVTATIGVLAAWALTFGGFVLVGVSLARRRALQVLASSYGARRGAGANERPACRNCGAPLATADSAIARCGYCSAENILGLALQPRVVEAATHREAIATRLAAVGSERRTAIFFAAIAIAATLTGALFVTTSVTSVLDYRDQKFRCHHEKSARACFAAALSNANGSVGAKDEALALGYFVMACEYGHAEACRDAAVRFELGWGTARDETRRQKYLQRSCTLGWQPACTELSAP